MKVRRPEHMRVEAGGDQREGGECEKHTAADTAQATKKRRWGLRHVISVSVEPGTTRRNQNNGFLRQARRCRSIVLLPDHPDAYLKNADGDRGVEIEGAAGS